MADGCGVPGLFQQRVRARRDAMVPLMVGILQRMATSAGYRRQRRQRDRLVFTAVIIKPQYQDFAHGNCRVSIR